MKTIPELLKKNQELIDKAMVDYELIEEFNYSISAEDFSAKYVEACRNVDAWVAVRAPTSISKKARQNNAVNFFKA
jgi:orotate phosphoribosyltransferase-like protein